MALSPQERSRRMRLNMLMAMSYAVAGRSAFTPLNLFSAGEQGAWYDPSDFSTMFQDAAGTTPVTAVEQPVGLIRDKSGRGNHASQTTSTSRPVLSARVNLLTYTEQFDNAVWAKGSFTGTISANTLETTDPLGTNTADKFTAAAINDFVSQAVTTVAATYTYSFYAKAGTASSVRVNVFDGTDHRVVFSLVNGTASGATGVLSNSAQSVGNGWWLLQITYSAAAISNSTRVLCPEVGSIYVWGADLRVTNSGTGLPPYQRVGASTDYDTTGFPYYLSFDGTDDFLVTGTINPGSVDKAQVFAGVRKLSDASANGLIAELGAGSANGSFFMAGPRGAATATYRFVSQGTTLTEAFASAGYAAPITNILTGTSDIGSPFVNLRINGTQIQNTVTTQGTGNYLTNPLYIGRRGGTTLPFNGRLYGLIVRFSAANLPDADIVKTETWLNARTGAY